MGWSDGLDDRHGDRRWRDSAAIIRMRRLNSEQDQIGCEADRSIACHALATSSTTLPDPSWLVLVKDGAVAARRDCATTASAWASSVTDFDVACLESVRTFYVGSASLTILRRRGLIIARMITPTWVWVRSSLSLAI
jgi:hypothetical protein